MYMQENHADLLTHKLANHRLESGIVSLLHTGNCGPHHPVKMNRHVHEVEG